MTRHAPLDDKLSRLLSVDAYTISAEEAVDLRDALFLDAREKEEYQVSHLPGALHLGYDRVKYDLLESYGKDTPIVVYCTVGYRSEKIAEKLRKRGYSSVHNLYGSLYAWKLAGLPLVDDQGSMTDRIHTYNEKWGRLIPDDLGEKVH
ncbi:hypothetical protein A3850_002775 [Lewinella sp. 4G2]|nr:hypothetical protein A3850_002775 [Lewinella sp. 4G2]